MIELILAVLIVLLVIVFIIGLSIVTKVLIRLSKDFENRTENYEDQMFEKNLQITELQNEHENRTKRWIERFLVEDAHHNAEKRVLLFLLLDRVGIKLPQNENVRLHDDFIKEGLERTNAINEEEARLRKEYFNGVGK